MAENLAGLREAVELAQKALNDGLFNSDKPMIAARFVGLLGNIADQQSQLIAAQQRRIEALEAGLRFFAGAYARWQKELADEDASNDFLTWAINNGGFLDNVDGAFERAYDLLRAEKGGEG